LKGKKEFEALAIYIGREIMQNKNKNNEVEGLELDPSE